MDRDSTSSGKIFCGTCNRIIHNVKNIPAHIRRHLTYRPYSCPYCNFKTFDEIGVERHISVTHDGMGLRVRFRPESALEQSYKELLSACREVKPDDAQEENVLATSATSGQLLEKSGAFVKCHVCSALVEKSSENLLGHVKTHVAFQGFKCDLCLTHEEPFVSFTQLEDHFAEAHSEVQNSKLVLQSQELSILEKCLRVTTLCFQPSVLQSLLLPCALCLDQVSLQKETLFKHVQSHGFGVSLFTCNTCGDSFSELTDTFEHMKRCHRQCTPLLNISASGTDLKHSVPLLKTCFPLLSAKNLTWGAKYQSDPSEGRYYLNERAVKVSAPEVCYSEKGSSPPDDISVPPVSLSTPATPSVLEACLKGQHVPRTTPSYPSSKIRCGMCKGCVEPSEHSISAHVKSHIVYKPYTCSYCPYRNATVAQIRRHVTTSHPRKPFAFRRMPQVTYSRQVSEMRQRCFPNHIAWRGGVSKPSAFGLSHSPNQSVNEINNNSTRHSNNVTVTTSAIAKCLSIDTLSSRLRENAADNIKKDGGELLASGSLPPPPPLESWNVGKKLCQKCQTYIANNPSSFENHACKHLDYKPFHCCYCPYQSYIRGKVTRHQQQVHQGQPVKIRKVEVSRKKANILAMKLECFPFLKGTEEGQSVGGTAIFDQALLDEDIRSPMDFENNYSMLNSSSSLSPEFEHSSSGLMSASPIQTFAGMPVFSGDSSERMTPLPLEPDIPMDATSAGDDVSPPDIGSGMESCALCMEGVSKVGYLLEEHISFHIVQKLYVCSVCELSSESQSDVVEHLESSHELPDATNHLLVCPPEGISALRKLRAMCFPNVYGSCMDTPSPPPLKKGGTLLVDDLNLPVITSEGTPFGSPSFEDKFSQLAELNRNSGQKPCALCFELVSQDVLSIKRHVDLSHGSVKMYRCSFCRASGETAEDIRIHISVTHSPSVRAGVNRESDSHTAMKRCFPSFFESFTESAASHRSSLADRSPYFGGDVTSGTISKKLQCEVCQNTVADNPKSIGIHIKNHLGYKPYRCPNCSYTSCEQSKARRHIEHVHGRSGDELLVEKCSEEEIKVKIANMKEMCFPKKSDPFYFMLDDPELTTYGGRDSKMNSSPCPSNMNAIFDDVITKANFACHNCSEKFHSPKDLNSHVCTKSHHEASSLSRSSMDWAGSGGGMESDFGFNNHSSSSFHHTRGRNPNVSARIVCSVCNQTIAANANSTDVHIKNHLDYKPHVCGYCEYKSCILGKVKRHIDTVHRGCEPKLESSNYTSTTLRQILQTMKMVCFPTFCQDTTVDTIPEFESKAETSAFLNQKKAEFYEELSKLSNGAFSAVPPAPSKPTDGISGVSLFAQVSNFSGPGYASPFPGSGNQDVSKADFEDSAPNTPSNGLVGQKIECSQCRQQIADNPSSMGVHVRNHLNYRPFSCNFCSYRSCVQAKVKRHLASVHRSETQSELTFEEDLQTKNKIPEWKLKCFPFNDSKNKDLGLSLMCGQSDNSKFERERDSQSRCSDALSSDSIDFVGATGASSETLSIEHHEKKCNLCDESVPNSFDMVVEHVNNHMEQALCVCDSCEFFHSSSEAVKDHIDEEHGVGEAEVASTLPNFFGTFEATKLRCFPDSEITMELDETSGLNGDVSMKDDSPDESSPSDSGVSSKPSSGKEGPKYVCQLCNFPVSHYASSLYIHVKNHMDYKPYRCLYCDYRSPVKSKVRRHNQNQHKDSPNIVDYLPKVGVEREIMEWKKKCFPDVKSFMSVANDKVTCGVCQTDVADTPLSRQIHAKNHLDAKPFHCAYCNYKSCLKGETRRHIVRQHSGRSAQMDQGIIFCKKEEARLDKVDKMIEQCFGASPSVSSP